MFIQSFGDTVDAVAEDVVTAMDFNKSGTFLGVGDRGGRIILFKRTTNSPKKKTTSTSGRNSKSKREWVPYFQFQSHDSEFDYLKSLDIDEKICSLKFFPNAVGDSHLILSTNEKSVKLWKVSHRSKNFYCDDKNPEQLTNCSGNLLNPHVKSVKDLKLPSPCLYNFNGEESWSSCMESNAQKEMYAVCRRNFLNGHLYNINSISLHCDGESFLSSDDLRVNWWNVERNLCCYNLIDIKPECMEELTEVITCAQFHPAESPYCVYATSAGNINVIDTRSKSVFDRAAQLRNKNGWREYRHTTSLNTVDTASRSFSSSGIFSRVNALEMNSFNAKSPYDSPREPDFGHKQSGSHDATFFNEIVNSISDIRFMRDPRFLVSRDFLTIKVWDLALTQRGSHADTPVAVIPVHDHIKHALGDMFESDSIFDRFTVATSPDCDRILSGSYSNQFYVFSRETGASVQVGSIGSPRSGSRKLPSITPSTGGGGTFGDVSECGSQKILNVAWCSDGETIATAGQSGLYIYKI